MLTTILILAVMLISGVVQGTTGFGSGLVALGLLGSFTDPKEASVMILMPNFAITIYLGWRLRSYFKLERMAPMLAMVVVGVPLGVIFLARADKTVFQIVVGWLLIVSGVHGLIPYLAKRPWHHVYLGAPSGLAAGLLSGAFGTGGPPAVAYLSSQNLDRFRYVATLQMIFGVGAIARMASLGAVGLYTTKIFVTSLIGAAFSVAGAFLGLHILSRLSDSNTKRIVCVCLLLLGAWYLYPLLMRIF